MRHAYLILIHNNFDVVNMLLSALDDLRNDIYIHIDKKFEKFFDKENLKLQCKKSNIYFIKSLDTRWGDYSLVQAEIELLKAIKDERYEYYHLLSGADMPIKSQDYIHKFFENNKGKEFIDFSFFDEERILFRIKGFHFTKWTKSKKIIKILIDKVINKVFKILFFKLKFKRKNCIEKKLMYGSQWFSISDDLREYVIENELWIKKNFKNTSCPDEHFLQTIVYNSNFKNSIYSLNFELEKNGAMRLIKWEADTPHVFSMEDEIILDNSNMLFARKFEQKKDIDIVKKILSKF